MSNSSEIAYIRYMIKLNDDLNIYFTLIGSGIGIVGNLLSIAVFSRLIFHQKTNMAFLYIIQCLCDLSLLLITLLIVRGSPLIFGVQFYSLSDSWCKAWAFLRRFTIHISSWMIVLTTFDRFTFVIYENRRFGFIRDKRVLALIILLMFTFLAVCDLGNLFYFIDPKLILLNCSGNYATVLATDVISLLLRTYIPLTLMLVFNIIMLRKIFKSRRRVKNMRTTTTSLNSQQSSHISRKEQQFTFAVISYDVIFFIDKLPITVYYVLYDINLYSGAFKNTSFYIYYSFLLNVFLNISMFDQIFSFFMNLAFNKIFRHELLRFIRCASLRSNSSIDHSLAYRSSHKT